MSVEGKALVGYRGGTYTFVQDEPGRWNYAIEIMGQGKRGSGDYLAFLEEMGIEVVATYASRAYLRKRNDGKPFEVHSDLASRLDQVRRGNYWTYIALTQLVLAIVISVNVLVVSPETSDFAKELAVGTSAVLVIAAAVEYLRLGKPYRERIRRLKNELSIKE